MKSFDQVYEEVNQGVQEMLKLSEKIKNGNDESDFHRISSSVFHNMSL